MAIQDILIHADSTYSFEARLKYTIALAKKNNAHLTALYVVPKYIIPAYAGVPMDPGILQQTMDFERELAKSTRIKLETITSRKGCKVEWREEEGDPTRCLNTQGRYFDLAVLGQTDPAWNDDYITGSTNELIVNLGRPCLVVPFAGVPDKPAKRILVAWNGSSSASRAINDAMPILQSADLVEVLSVNPEKNNFDEGDIPSADISLHLARHGVKAVAKGTHAKNASNGELVLSHASNMGADMIVMGAYGHSRFRELIFGGTTRYLLKHMTVPVFMSH